MARRTQKPAIQLAEYWQGTFRRRRRFLIAVGGIVGTLIVSLGLFNIVYAKKVFPGVMVGGIYAGGLTKEELAARLDQQVKAVDGQELKVTIGEDAFEANPIKDWQLSYDIEDTVEAVFQFGRRRDFVVSLKEQLGALFSSKTIFVDYAIDTDAYYAWIEQITHKVEVLEQDARLVLTSKGLVVEAEKVGRRITDDKLNRSVLYALATLAFFPPITLSLTDVPPAVTAASAEALKSDVARLISNDLTLTFNDRTFLVTTSDILGFIELAADPGTPSGAVAVINEARVLQKIESIARDIDQTPVDARLTITNGRASIFTPSRDGYRVKRDEAAKQIADALEERRADKSVTEIQLAVEVTRAAVRTETINDLGIKELIGKGTTSFAGSPPNRVHNISVGANSFNGLLIKPGETFSTIAALGKIDASTGYKPELVIREDRLIPETGGGLCQVSTTLFRAVLNAGLPVVERKNHSFRVRYYEPPVGMDATIYDPAPDLKFTNDTPGYILIQTKVEGTKLTFELYGTKDGRVATTTTPVVYNITQPGDPVYIEDPTLPPGEQIQIEKAVPGADARFTYTVKRNGETIYAKTFTSHYVAWRAKYRVGPVAQPSPAEVPSAE